MLDYGAESQVLIATPMTLLALLKTIALGWHQHSMNENAERISRLGREVYRRLQGMMAAFGKVGQSLSLSLSSYQDTIASLEKTILPETLELGRLTEIGGVSPAALSPSRHKNKTLLPLLEKVTKASSPSSPEPSET